MFSSERVSRRRPVIRSPGAALRVPISVGAIPARISDCASDGVRIGGVRVESEHEPLAVRLDASGRENPRSQFARAGTQPAGTALTAPLVHCAASGASSGDDRVRTNGRPSSDRVISASSPASAIMSATA